jgi:hypothetical protein
MRKLILMILITVGVSSCGFDTKSEGVEQIRIGMSEERACELLNMEVGEWDEFDTPNEYRYGSNYLSPSGYKKTFWIYVIDGKVTHFHTN